MDNLKPYMDLLVLIRERCVVLGKYNAEPPCAINQANMLSRAELAGHESTLGVPKSTPE